MEDTKFSCDMDEVVELSDELVQYLEDDMVPMTLGAASVALTLARLLSNRKLTYEEGEKFISSIVSSVANCFAEGSVN